MNPFSRWVRIKVASSAQFRPCGESSADPDLEDFDLGVESVGEGFWVRMTGMTGERLPSVLDCFRGLTVGS